MFLIFLTKKKSYAFFQSLNSLVILKKVNSISHAFINSLVDLCSKYLIIILIEILLMLTQITLNRKYKTAELGNKMSFSMFCVQIKVLWIDKIHFFDYRVEILITSSSWRYK